MAITTEQLKSELSIAGNPDKLIAMMDEMLTVMHKADATNAAELINLELVMKRLLYESKLWRKMYEQRTNQKIN